MSSFLPPPLDPHLKTEPLMRLRCISKDYPTSQGPFTALHPTDLDLYPGDLIAVVGKSGAGKTTLINMLSGVDHLTQGEVWFQETPLHTLSEDQLARWRGKNLGMVYQSFYLMPGLNLIQNILLPLDFCGGFHRKESTALALNLLERVEMVEHANKTPSEISGGQQQRVAIARAIVNDPPLIVADEPTGRLDSTTAETIFQIFSDLAGQGKAVLMVTHDASFARRATRSMEIVDGRLQSLSYERILDSHENPI